MPTDDRGFQLGLLPERRRDWRTFAASYGILSGFIVLLIMVGIMASDDLLPGVAYHVTELVPRPSLKPWKQPKPKPLPLEAKLPPAPVFDKPRLIVPHEVRAPKPQPQEIEPPKVAINFAPAVLKATSGARPVLIHTGEFQGSSAIPVVNAPASKVQTGGFNDPNGLKPSDNSKPNGKLIASAAGSFDMPVGPGKGNGSGGAKGIQGTVASADFGSGVATGGQADGRRSGRGNAAVQSSGFGSQQIAQNTPHTLRTDPGLPTSSVEITYKPNPAYTEEARNLKLEGEVLLEVEFGAAGQLRVNRVVRGLGHGLDEAAIAAANKMKFKPALRNGQAVDSTAVVHVVFQLAY